MGTNFPNGLNGRENPLALDRSPAEKQIRALALRTALSANRALAEGDCDRIVAAAVSQLSPDQLRTGQISADILTRVAEMTQKALEVGPVNQFGSTASQIEARAKQDGVPSHLLNGQWTGVQGRTNSSESAAERVSYRSLSLSDARSLQGITAHNFASSPFAGAGVDFGTFAYLRAQGPFSAQNILNASNDAKTLGFKTNDRAAMLDHATIDRFDPKARQTNNALQDYQRRLEGDTDLAELHRRRKSAATAEDRKAIDGEIAERRARHAQESGLRSRIDDPNGYPKAVKATKSRKTAIEKKAEESYLPNVTPEKKAQVSQRVKTKANADLFKQLTGASPK